MQPIGLASSPLANFLTNSRTFAWGGYFSLLLFEQRPARNDKIIPSTVIKKL